MYCPCLRMWPVGDGKIKDVLDIGILYSQNITNLFLPVNGVFYHGKGTEGREGMNKRGDLKSYLYVYCGLPKR